MISRTTRDGRSQSVNVIILRGFSLFKRTRAGCWSSPLDPRVVPPDLLYVRHLLAKERDLEILIDVDLLGTEVDDFVRLTQGGSHLV